MEFPEVSMNELNDAWMDVQRDTLCMDGWMDGLIMDGCMNGWME